jgi:ATP-dependent helicase/nuclease subunit B
VLSIVTGRSGSGKSHLLVDKVREEMAGREDGGKIYFLVPEQYTLQCERDLIEGLGLTGTLTIEVLSISRLTTRVLEECGGLTRQPMDQQGKLMLIRRVMMELEDSLAHLRSHSGGMLEEIASLIENLKRNDLNIEDLIEAAEQMKDERLLRKLRDMEQVYVGYQQVLAEGYVDPEESYLLLNEKLEHSKVFRGRKIFVDGFTQFSSQGLGLLEQLLALGNDLTLVLPFDERPEEGSLFAAQAGIIERLTSYCAHEKIKIRREHLDKVYRQEELAFLQRNLFSFPHGSWDKEPLNLEVFEARDREQESRYVAHKIACQIKAGDVNPRDITVMCDKLDDYYEPLARWFSAYGIPVHFDHKISLYQDSFISHVLRSLKLIGSFYSQSQWRQYLSSAYVSDDLTLREELENTVMRMGLTRGALREYLKGIDCMKPLSGLEEQLKGAEKVEDMVLGLYHYLESQGAFTRLTEEREAHLVRRDFQLAARTAQVYGLLISVLEQMVSLMGKETLTLDEFLEILETGLGGKQLGEIPSGIDQVLVGSLPRSKSHDISFLYLLGFNEGIIPANIRESALLSHREADRLKEKGLDLGLDSASLYRKEKMDLYLAMAKANQGMFISYTRATMLGEGLQPSALVQRLKKMYPALNILVQQDDELLPITRQEGCVWPADALERGIEDTGLYLRGEELSEESRYNLQALYQGGFKDTLDNLLSSEFSREPSLRLGREVATELYGPTPKMSISSLEKMAACPFSYFVAKGLKPVERKEGVVESSDLGTFFHESFYHYAQALAKDQLGWDIDEAERKKRMEKAMDMAVADDEMIAVRKDPSFSRYRKMADNSVRQMTEQLRHGSFEPSFFEVRFGKDESLPPIYLQADESTTLELRGVIDRADVYREKEKAFVRLIDYKSGNKDFDFGLFYHGLSLQLAVYAKALHNAAEALGVQSVQVGAALYFHIDSQPVILEREDENELKEALRKRFAMKGLVLKDVELVGKMDGTETVSPTMQGVKLNKNGSFGKNKHLVSAEELAIICQHGFSKAEEFAGRIVQGEVGVSPYRYGADKSACTWCDYRSMCFFEEKRMNYRKLEEFKGASANQDVLARLEESDELD